MFEKNEDKQQVQWLVEKGIAEAAYSQARAYFRVKKAEKDVTEIRFLKAAADASYEYVMEEALHQWPAIGDRIRAHKLAIDKKQEKDHRQYRNSGSAYLTLLHLITGNKPGAKEEKAVKKIDDHFRQSFRKACVRMSEIEISDKDTAQLLYDQMMTTLQDAAKTRLVAIFDDPTGFLGTILAITSYLIRTSLEENSGSLTKDMCQLYYEELSSLRCNVDLVAQKASADLQQLIGTSLEAPDQVNSVMEKLFAMSLKQNRKEGLKGAALIGRHRQICLWVLENLTLEKVVDAAPEKAAETQ